jgi:hypothetical protein
VVEETAMTWSEELVAVLFALGILGLAGAIRWRREASYKTLRRLRRMDVCG